jgi:hypothetical protein
MLKKSFLFFIAIIVMYSCQSKDKEKVQTNSTQEIKEKELKMEFKLTSSAFEEGGMIPQKYTCDSDDVSPPLMWGTVPEGTKSLILICDDPDAPVGTWVHWVLYDLPSNIKELPENVPVDETLENGAKQGTNDFGNIGYGGPCPPSGTHRYVFKLYALDSMLELGPGKIKAEVLDAIEGHLLAETQLMGKYSRQ